jgi:hypothetical protein
MDELFILVCHDLLQTLFLCNCSFHGPANRHRWRSSPGLATERLSNLHRQHRNRTAINAFDRNVKCVMATIAIAAKVLWWL